jgi:predicted DNA-binding transcriptional regulator YafY
MTDESATSRALRVLSLLQTRRSWPGSELAERVGASPRTIRRDIDRLRELGYRITAERGVLGGYRLEAGSDLPPLVFSGDEAVALALGMRAGAIDSPVRGMADLTVSVLAKLEQVLPVAVHARLRAMGSAVPPSGPVRTGDLVDPETIAVLALACRDSELVRFSHRSADGAHVARHVEPTALVPVGRRWYLLGWDTARADWRTFRLDRISDPRSTRVVMPRRSIPGDDPVAFVTSRLGGTGTPRFSATIRISAPHPEVEAYLGAFTSGLEPDGPDRTRWRIADDRLEILAGALTWLIWPFTIEEGDELRGFAKTFAARLSG